MGTAGQGFELIELKPSICHVIFYECCYDYKAANVVKAGLVKCCCGVLFLFYRLANGPDIGMLTNLISSTEKRVLQMQEVEKMVLAMCNNN